MTRLPALVPLLCCGLVFAADPEQLPVYDVELVVFAHSRPLLGSEKWPPQTLAAAVEGALDLAAQADAAPAGDSTGAAPTASDTATGTGDAIARTEPALLLEQVARMRKMSNFEVLLHRAWRQPGYGAEQARAIRLSAAPLDEPVLEQLPPPWEPRLPALRDAPVYDDYDAANAVSLAQPPVTDQPAAAQAPTEASGAIAMPLDNDSGQPVAAAVVTHALDGTLTLVRSRFLHVYVDLILTLPANALAQAVESAAPRAAAITTGSALSTADARHSSALPAPSMQSFPIRIHRRMRSKELHYLDHPLLGIVLQVTPVETDGDTLSD